MGSLDPSQKMKLCLNCETRYAFGLIGVTRPCECGLCIPTIEKLAEAITHYEETLKHLKNRMVNISETLEYQE